MTPEDLDRLEALAAAATKGPWRAGRMDTESYYIDGSGPFKNVYADDPRGGVHPQLGEILPYVVATGEGDECRDNAAFIAASREAVPALIAEVRRLTVQRDGLRDDCDMLERELREAKP
jgi:hypothetical protein